MIAAAGITTSINLYLQTISLPSATGWLISTTSRVFSGFALGYSETCVFTRAFRRWSGMAPVMWRKEHRSSTLIYMLWLCSSTHKVFQGNQEYQARLDEDDKAPALINKMTALSGGFN